MRRLAVLALATILVVVPLAVAAQSPAPSQTSGPSPSTLPTRMQTVCLRIIAPTFRSAAELIGFILDGTARIVSTVSCDDPYMTGRTVPLPTAEPTPTRKPRPTPKPTRRPRPQPAVSFGEGTWRVGRDIRPGTYRSRSDGDDLCYWERLRGFSGDVDDIIANDAISSRGPVVVRIASSDRGFMTRGCATWRRIGR